MQLASYTGSLAVFFSLLSLFVLYPLSRVIRLVDLPDHRKSHKGAVPLIGGLSAFAGVGIAWLISMPLHDGFGIYLLCSLLIVALGAIDDARDVPAKFRLWAQVALGAFLAYGSGIHLTSFGNLLGLGDIELGWLGPVVTIAAVIGATNAYNMADGIDGLAGSLSLISLVSLAILFYGIPELSLEFVLAAGIAMALLPYMAANLRIPPFRSRIFMGDAGSMFIGLSIVWLLVSGVHGTEAAFRPVTALWICAVPLMDMVAIMIRRARKGQSVMMPDRDHLHHIFLRAGFTDRQALFVITVIATVMALIGIGGEFVQLPEWVMFVSFMLIFGIYNACLRHVWRLLAVFRRLRLARKAE